MKNDKPDLLFISEKTIEADAAARLLSPDFNVTVLPPGKVRHDDVRDLTYCVCRAKLSEIDRDALKRIQSNVTGKNGVLFVMQSGLDIPLHSDLFGFIGSRGESMINHALLTLHVFPHYLTRGIAETVEAEDAVCANLQFSGGFSPISDNAFIEDMDSNLLAYERVYGLKGRVIVLAVGSRDGLSELEGSILRNLRLLKSTAEDLEINFKDDITRSFPLRENVHMEEAGDICRWNTLFTGDMKDVTYTHSAVFLPGSPEFCRERVSVWAKHDDGVFTKERLWQSLMSVEIRNTDFCSQNCRYCYNRRDMDVKHVRASLPEELHISMETDLLDMKERMGHRFFVRYTGTGEPLNHSRTLPSLLAFERAGIATALITNGELLSAREAAALGRHGTYVRFSVDASDSRTYCDIRGCGENVFGTVRGNITAMADNKCYIGATFLVCRENFTQVFSFCRLMKSLGVRAAWIRSTDGCDAFSSDETELINMGIDRALGLRDSGFIVTANQFKIYRNVSLLHYKYDSIRCWSGHTKAFIQPNGDVIICLSRPDYVIGNLNEHRFSEIWGGERHLHFLTSVDVSACSQCIESRYNSAVDFIARNHAATIYKGTRALAMGGASR